MAYKTEEERVAAKKARQKRAMDKYLANPDNYAKVLERNKKWSDSNKEKHRELQRDWKCINRDKVNASARKSQASSGYSASKKFQAANPEKVSQWGKRWKGVNAHKVRAYVCKREAQLVLAKPRWADDFVIEEIYDLARLRTEITGILWEVDHEVPLINKKVCGLHCEANLRVITKVENRKKSNTFNI